MDINTKIRRAVLATRVSQVSITPITCQLNCTEKANDKCDEAFLLRFYTSGGVPEKRMNLNITDHTTLTFQGIASWILYLAAMSYTFKTDL